MARVLILAKRFFDAVVFGQQRKLLQYSSALLRAVTQTRVNSIKRFVHRLHSLPADIEVAVVVGRSAHAYGLGKVQQVDGERAAERSAERAVMRDTDGWVEDEQGRGNIFVKRGQRRPGDGKNIIHHL